MLGQYGSCSTAQWPVELSKNIIQNLFNKLPHQTVDSAVNRVGSLVPILSTDFVLNAVSHRNGFSAEYSGRKLAEYSAESVSVRNLSFDD